MKLRSFVLSPFFISLFLGALSWLLIYIITPASPVFSISTSTFSFVLLSYISLILGYIILPNKSPQHTLVHRTFNSWIWIVIGFVFLGFGLRFFDLFVLRGVDFGNSISYNRELIYKNPSEGVFILGSLIRYLFFVPLILYFFEKRKDKLLLFFCTILFVLPFVEGMIRGSRNSFFYPSILFIFILFYFRLIQWKARHIVGICLSGVLLFLIATMVLKKREMKTDQDYINLTSKAIYNDFLEPKESVIQFIQKSDQPLAKQLMISGLQTGQYFTHGIFEFNHLMKTYSEKGIKHQFGKYNFYNYVKLSQKYGFTDTDISKIPMANPRGYSFITFFGGIYIDFGWFGLLFMFILGMLQKHLFIQVKKRKGEFLPLFLFLIFMNFFMLTFNFLRNTGVSIITINVLFIFLYQLLGKKNIENPKTH